MEAVVCKHIEQVSLDGGYEIGVCTECHQTIQYDEDHKNPTVTKLGRLGDKLVLPNPAYKLLLDPVDQQDLASVRQGGVPPKPQTGGMHAVKRYYEENREAILHDLDTLGEREMRKRWWNMSQATFFGLMARWRPEYPGIPKWGREKAKRVKRETPREGKALGDNKKIQELELALTSKSKEVETLREQLERMKQAICAAPVLVVEAYKAVATFTGEITKTVAAYGLKDAEGAAFDSEMESFDSLTGLLGDWVKLLRAKTRSDFDKGAIFALEMIKAVFECELALVGRIKQLAGELENGQQK